MRFVIKIAPTGEYVAGESWWNKRPVTDIHEAKLYHRKGQAQAIVNQWSERGYHKWTHGQLVVVPVTITEENN
jgi:hypothetical protein